MYLNRTVLRAALPLTLALTATVVISSCSERKPSPSVTPAATVPANTAPTSAGPTSSAPVIAPGAAIDVESKKGTVTGMVGGEAGTVASSGKPGTGTASGAGTGAAKSSEEKTENKK